MELSHGKRVSIFVTVFVVAFASFMLGQMHGQRDQGPTHKSFQAGFAECAHQVEDNYGGY